MLPVFKTICVCGAGTMGAGIAEVFALAGYPTLLYDLDEKVLRKASDKIKEDLQKLVARNKISAERKEIILQHLFFTCDPEACKGDLVIEAIVENLQAKISLLRNLEGINPNAVLASNTSSLPLTQIARELQNKESLVGLHFFNPAPLMNLVEVIYTEYTNPGILEAAATLVNHLGKTAVVCKDAPGFIVNRVARPFYIESLRIAEKGKVPLDTVDRLLESRGFKMGPFKLMDLIGNDINFAVSKSLYEQLNKPERLKPSVLQEEKIEKGELGKKTGGGFFKY